MAEDETLKDQARRLAEPFDAKVLGDVQGMTYVPVAEVIARLNLVVPGWCWSTAEFWMMTDPADDSIWLMARGTLTADVDGHAISMDGVGGQQVKTKRADPHPWVDIGNEYKGAESDALKKAAQRLGVGLDLARKEEAVALERKALDADLEAAARGWRNEATRVATNDGLHERIKALPAESRQTIKQALADEAIGWPPETPAVAARVEALLVPLEGGTPAQESEEPTEGQDAQPEKAQPAKKAAKKKAAPAKKQAAASKPPEPVEDVPTDEYTGEGMDEPAGPQVIEALVGLINGLGNAEKTAYSKWRRGLGLPSPGQMTLGETFRATDYITELQEAMET